MEQSGANRMLKRRSTDILKNLMSRRQTNVASSDKLLPLIEEMDVKSESDMDDNEKFTNALRERNKKSTEEEEEK